MTFGGRFTNQNNVVTIDERYRNLSLIRKGTVTLNSNSQTQLIKYSGNTAFLAFNVSVSGWDDSINAPNGVAVEVVRDNGNYDFNFYGKFFSGGATSGVVYTVNYYIFDTDDSFGNDSYGFRVFDGNNKLVFDSSKKYMRVIGFQDAPIAPPNGRNYAYIFPSNNYETSTDYDEDGTAASIIIDLMGIGYLRGNFGKSQLLIRQTDYNYNENTAYYYSTIDPVMTIDVTNY